MRWRFEFQHPIHSFIPRIDLMHPKSLFARCAANWFLIGLGLCLLCGYGLRHIFAGAAEAKGWQHGVIAAVMFLMAVSIDFSVVRNVLRRPYAPLLACGVNLVLAPLLTWPLVGWLGPELGPGFAVVAATPCTLASAAVWTRRAGGNEVVAILVTLLTNLACFWVLPTWIYLIMARSATVQNIGAVGWMLFWIVVVPIVAAQLVRRNSKVGEIATRHRQALGVFCQLGILSIVLVGSVKMFARLDAEPGLSMDGSVLLRGGLVALGLHLMLFATGFWGAAWLRLPRDEQLAVAFSGSQKTLMVGLSAAIELGYSIIPLVLYHVLQLFADTLLADRLRRRGG